LASSTPAIAAHRVQVTVPGKLAERGLELFLLLEAQQETERFLDHGTLGAQTGRGQGLAHQLIVDVDIGAHWSFTLGMEYVYRTQGFRYEADVRRAERLLAPLDCYILGGDALARASARNYRRLRRLGITPRSSIDVLIDTFCAENDNHVLASDRDFELMAPHLGFVLV
jgi:hypothetical protein